jgi:hypothetical protein
MAKWLILLALLPVAGCGSTRRYGDAGGVPVPFDVRLERSFVHDMQNRQWRPSVGAGAAFGSGGYSSYGTGVGLSFSSTEVYLLGGDGPAESQIFRREISWGDNSFSVPLAVGHVVHLTVMAQGGREGWESIGTITVPNAIDPRVRIVLDRDSVSLSVTPAPAAVAPQPVAESATGAPPAAEEHQPLRPQPPDAKPPAVEIRPAPPSTAVTPAAPYPDPALDR